MRLTVQTKNTIKIGSMCKRVCSFRDSGETDSLFAFDETTLEKGEFHFIKVIFVIAEIREDVTNTPKERHGCLLSHICKMIY